MIDRALREAARLWCGAGRRAIVVVVVAARGSVPRPAGTRMVVAEDEAIGTIGGGHLELQALAAARRLLGTTDGPIRSEQHFALGPSLGQCCGGAVTLAFVPLDEPALAAWPVAAPRFHLQLHGAGHVGRAIATLLATLDVEVAWFDQRDDGFPATTSLGSAWPAHIRRICIDTVEAEVASAPAGACYLVLTHEHALDLRIAEAVLRRADFAYCGLIGSRTKRASFERRYRERGIDAETLARLTCPIGIEGIDGKEPEVIAATVVAQLLLVAAGERPFAGRAPDRASRRGERPKAPDVTLREKL